MEETTINRRGVIKTLLAGAATLAGLRLAKSASASGPEGSSAHSWAMVIDQSKCTGCEQCTLSCRAHNDIPPEISWNRVIKAGMKNGEPVFCPRPCMQCENAPCVEVCMVKATQQRADGIVMMDYDRCIGCRYCEIACPYSARAFNWETFDGDNPAGPRWGNPEIPRRPRGVTEKCSFCYQRIDRGMAHGLTPGVDDEATPACVVVCPTDARSFGDLNDPGSNVSQLLASHPYYRLREDLGTNPRVYYLAAHGEVT